MRAGLLRHRVTIQYAVETRSSSGAVQKEWQNQQVVSASIDPLKGDKLVQAQQVCPRATHEVRLRGRIPLTSAQRFVFAERSGETLRERFLNVGYITRLQERGITTVAFVTEVPA